MQPGPPRGESVTTTVTVTSELTEDAPGASGRPVIATRGVLDIVTGVARDIIEPHLGPMEVAVTSMFEVQHRAPIPEGAISELVVTVAQVSSTRMLCDFVFRHNGTVAVRGSHEQAMLEASNWRERIDDSR